MWGVILAYSKILLLQSGDCPCECPSNLPPHLDRSWHHRVRLQSLTVSFSIWCHAANVISYPFIAEEQTADYYDGYIDAYRDQAPPPIQRNNTVASWARNNANPPSRSLSMRPPPSSYSGGGGVRRRGSTAGRQRSVVRRKPTYEEEEEGYGSGDYDDGPGSAEFSKIRVKVCFKDEVRGLALTPDVTYAEFMGMLSSKFTIPVGKLDVKFKDEDGGHVSMKDEMDYEMALETAKESASGKVEGRLEVLCAET